MVLTVDDQIGQVSRLLQMPAGVSEHCSVVPNYFVMVIRIFMLSTMINHHFHHCVIDHSIDIAKSLEINFWPQVVPGRSTREVVVTGGRGRGNRVSS